MQCNFFSDAGIHQPFHNLAQNYAAEGKIASSGFIGDVSPRYNNYGSTQQRSMAVEFVNHSYVTSLTSSYDVEKRIPTQATATKVTGTNFVYNLKMFQVTYTKLLYGEYEKSVEWLVIVTFPMRNIMPASREKDAERLEEMQFENMCVSGVLEMRKKYSTVKKVCWVEFSPQLLNKSWMARSDRQRKAMRESTLRSVEKRQWMRGS